MHDMTTPPRGQDSKDRAGEVTGICYDDRSRAFKNRLCTYYVGSSNAGDTVSGNDSG